MTDTERPDPESLLQGLDEMQLRAAHAICGPVRIIAGAGAGKTRTITRRIAYGCATDMWNPKHVLAVTFSTKAAREMKVRLEQLGVGDVHAATFHSAALGQLRRVWSSVTTDDFPGLVSVSRQALVGAVQAMSGRDDVSPMELRDIAAEINWMKVSLIAPEDYPKLCEMTQRMPPAQLDPDVFARLADEYERRKAAVGVMDFNDILLLTCHILERFPEQAASIQRTIESITVDEYQDVSPLQHRLLRLWLGPIREICVVGDSAQTIYSFAGATNYYLRNFGNEFAPVKSDIVLNRDYRSTPQIVKYANNVLAPSPCCGDYIQLESARDDGQGVRLAQFDDEVAEAKGIAAHIHRLVGKGVAVDDIGVLTRTNDELRPIASALHAAGVPYALLRMPSPSDAESDGDPDAPSAPPAPRHCVTLSTIHSAKGLEWKYVFVAGCAEGQIPFGNPQTQDELEEERRLMYVAVTRAQDRLFPSYPARKSGARGMMRRDVSRFLLGR